ncbi:hypothetical protein GGQ66_002136 [Rhizobium borbori]|uniref:Lipoprotein n=1 Tax=Allorhizobium borbori TaxID=485907 RepID=A0A7W6K1P2_9HYPH|nr:hypothetical protein [Allorhizobium borbori]
MKYNRVGILVMMSLALQSCGSITVPAAVKMDSGEAYVGTTTAAISGGTFQVTATSGVVTCSGTYDAFDTNPVISAPVRCSDGRYGTITVLRNPDMRGGSGTVTLANGSHGRVAFGRNASSVLSAPIAMSGLPTPSSTTIGESYSSGGGVYTGNCPTPESIAADGKRCGKRSAAYKAGGYSGYGLMSSARSYGGSTYVRGHYRNGSYVRGHYRRR